MMPGKISVIKISAFEQIKANQREYDLILFSSKEEILCSFIIYLISGWSNFCCKYNTQVKENVFQTCECLCCSGKKSCYGANANLYLFKCNSD